MAKLSIVLPSYNEEMNIENTAKTLAEILITENIEYELSKADAFSILLSHRADLYPDIKDTGVDLILSGHMHGGQIRLPWGNGVFSPTSSIPSGESLLFPKYFGGYYSYKDTHMIVNRGLGNPMIIPRLFNRPEITVITLTHKV